MAVAKNLRIFSNPVLFELIFLRKNKYFYV